MCGPNLWWLHKWTKGLFYANNTAVIPPSFFFKPSKPYTWEFDIKWNIQHILKQFSLKFFCGQGYHMISNPPMKIRTHFETVFTKIAYLFSKFFYNFEIDFRFPLWKWQKVRVSTLWNEVRWKFSLKQRRGSFSYYFISWTELFFFHGIVNTFSDFWRLLEVIFCWAKYQAEIPKGNFQVSKSKKSISTLFLPCPKRRISDPVCAMLVFVCQLDNKVL